MSKIWLTSDTHFGHAKVAFFRGFSSVEAHDAAIVENWNRWVMPGDTVHHLGDFAFVKKADLAGRLALLNGEKHLTLGNHDGTATSQRAAGWLTVEKQRIIEVAGARLWLSHIPQSGDWHESVRRYRRAPPPGLWDIAVCGHVHDLWTVGPMGDVNVALERWMMTPARAEEVVGIHRVGN